jgi:HSP20 family protein
LEKNPIIMQLKNLKNRMDTIFQENFGMGDHTDPAEPKDVPSWTPHVDIMEGGREWLLIADLPGVREEDVQVEVLENQIVISGSRTALPPIGERRALRAERPGGAFSRTFRLAPTAGPDNISARLSRGVLTVTIPKGEASSQSHKVSIVHE